MVYTCDLYWCLLAAFTCADRRADVFKDLDDPVWSSGRPTLPEVLKMLNLRLPRTKTSMAAVLIFRLQSALYLLFAVLLTGMIFYAWNILFERPLTLSLLALAGLSAYFLVFLWLIWPLFRPLLAGVFFGLTGLVLTASPQLVTLVVALLLLMALVFWLLGPGEEAFSKPHPRVKPPRNERRRRRMKGWATSLLALIPGLFLALHGGGPDTLLFRTVFQIKRDLLICSPYWLRGIPVQPDPPLAFLLALTGTALGAWALSLWIHRRHDVLWGGLPGVAFFIFQWLLGWDGATGHLAAYLFLLLFFQGLLALQKEGAVNPQDPSVSKGRPVLTAVFFSPNSLWFSSSFLGLWFLLLLARGLPAPDPLPWETVTAFLHETFPITEKFRGPGDGTGATEIGWSEGDLNPASTPLISSSQVALRLTFPDGVPDKVLYLRGLVYTAYFNGTWFGPLQPSLDFPELGWYSGLTAAEVGSRNWHSASSSKPELPPPPGNINSMVVGSTLPQPLTMEVRTDQGRIDQREKSPIPAPKGTEAVIQYKVTSLNRPSRVLFVLGEPLNIEGVNEIRLDAFGNLYSAGEPPKNYLVTSRWPEEPDPDLLRHSPPADPDQNPFLKVYLRLDLAKDHPDNPLVLPPGGNQNAARPPIFAVPYLPDRVAALAQQITAGATTPWEKARALEDYLRGYRYSLNPPSPAPGSDPVDTFLFETKTGYCLHFASALTVMLRAVGIPARLVEGFRVEPPAEDELHSNADNLGGWRTRRTVLDVPHSAAHTWVEAFFPGTGWVTMEPTPAYPLPLRQKPLPEPVNALSAAEERGTSGDGSQSWLGKIRRWGVSSPFDRPWLIVPWLLAMGLLVLFSLPVLYRLRQLRRHQANWTWWEYTWVTFLLEAAGWPRQKEETFREYMTRVSENMNLLSRLRETAQTSRSDLPPPAQTRAEATKTDIEAAETRAEVTQTTLIRAQLFELVARYEEFLYGPTLIGTSGAGPGGNVVLPVGSRHASRATRELLSFILQAATLSDRAGREDARNHPSPPPRHAGFLGLRRWMAFGFRLALGLPRLLVRLFELSPVARQNPYRNTRDSML